MISLLSNVCCASVMVRAHMHVPQYCFIRLFISVSACCGSVSMSMFTCIYLPVCPSVCLSICSLSVCLSICFSFVFRSLCLYLYLRLSVSLSKCFCIFVFLRCCVLELLNVTSINVMDVTLYIHTNYDYVEKPNRNSMTETIETRKYIHHTVSFIFKDTIEATCICM